jgi:hypothetical protein
MAYALWQHVLMKRLEMDMSIAEIIKSSDYVDETFHLIKARFP